MSTDLELDDSVLDDLRSMEELDPGRMLRAVATAGAQVREAAQLERDVLAGVAGEGRPRAVLVTGMGGSGIVADVAAAVAGRTCPVPVLAHRGHRLPGWVGPMDLVVAVSCSGSTEETLSALDEAMRRGARVVTVGAAGSPLARRSEDGRALHLPVDARGRMPRANLWGLCVPVLQVLHAVGLVQVDDDRLQVLADDLDDISRRCGPATDIAENPAKQLALQLAAALPYVWGSSDLAGVAAARFAAQLAENAKYPAVSGTLPEVLHNQVVVLAGRFGAPSADEDDIFRDRVDDGPGALRVRLLLLRDPDEAPEVGRRSDELHRLAERYDVPVDELTAEGDEVLLRLASLVGVLDFASVYLALLQGIDPSPIEPITVLKSGALEEDR